MHGLECTRFPKAPLLLMRSPLTDSSFPLPHWQVTKHGLEYPHFYRRLYGLLTPEAFHVSWCGCVPLYLPLFVTWLGALQRPSLLPPEALP